MMLTRFLALTLASGALLTGCAGMSPVAAPAADAANGDDVPSRSTMAGTTLPATVPANNVKVSLGGLELANAKLVKGASLSAATGSQLNASTVELVVPGLNRALMDWVNFGTTKQGSARTTTLELQYSQQGGLGGDSKNQNAAPVKVSYNVAVLSKFALVPTPDDNMVNTDVVLSVANSQSPSGAGATLSATTTNKNTPVKDVAYFIGDAQLSRAKMTGDVGFSVDNSAALAGHGGGGAPVLDDLTLDILGLNTGVLGWFPTATNLKADSAPKTLRVVFFKSAQGFDNNKPVSYGAATGNPDATLSVEAQATADSVTLDLADSAVSHLTFKTGGAGPVATKDGASSGFTVRYLGQ